MTWIVDRAASKIGFSIKHMMISTVKGSFSEFECDLEILVDELGASQAKAEIQTKSVSTKDKTRDDFLVSEDFFNPQKYPLICFQSTKVVVAGAQITLTGKLKIRDVERTVTLAGKVKGPKASFSGPPRLSFSLSGEIKRESFGLTFNPALDAGNILVGAKVKLFVEMVLIEEGAS